MFKRKYRVCTIINLKEDVPCGQCVVGLYKGGILGARGHAMGWYAQEYRKWATLIAYFVIEGHIASKGEKHIKEVVLSKPKIYRELHIYSGFQEHTIVAKNEKEAIDLFFNEKWSEETTFHF